VTLLAKNTPTFQEFNLPDGFYKGFVKFFSKLDANMFSVQVQVEAIDRWEKNI
jgi:hypothetical protein